MPNRLKLIKKKKKKERLSVSFSFYFRRVTFIHVIKKSKSLITQPFSRLIKKKKL